MTKNTGTPYEKLNQQIFSILVNQDSVDNIDVKHDVIINGKTINHQIDVYWEFKIGGIIYSTIVQAKHWNYDVNLGELLKFKAVLDDLPGQPRGIFITSKGYQKGAKKFAEKHGIVLYEMRIVTNEDLKDLSTTIIIEFSVFIPHTSGIEFEFDQDWVKKERKKLSIPIDKKIKMKIMGNSDNIIFKDSNGKKLSDLYSIINQLYPSKFTELSPKTKTHHFKRNTFIITRNSEFPRMKVNSVKATIAVYKDIEEVRIGGENIVKFILKNVLDENDKDRFFNENMESI